MIAEALLPEELNFLWQLWVGEPVDDPRGTTLARVEPARWDVGVLGFDFPEPATAETGDVKGSFTGSADAMVFNSTHHPALT
jgi:hypothetical protein